jgi:hypothetical protein
LFFSHATSTTTALSLEVWNTDAAWTKPFTVSLHSCAPVYRVSILAPGFKGQLTMLNIKAAPSV